MRYIDNKTFPPEVGAAIRYLKDLGIKDVNSFLYKPKPSDYESPWKLDNMREMIDALYHGFEEDKKFFLQVDSDTDGITSAAIFYNYFTMLYPMAHITYRVHDGKEHGVLVDTVPLDTDIVIIPDAGSNQIDEQESLSKTGRQVLIMDHHNVTHHYNIENVVIVNNQTSKEFTNKDLSGAGVVYKVIQAYDEVYGRKILYKRFEDLAALGIVADCMDVRHLDNNAIIVNGFNNVNNNMFKALIAQQSYKIGKDHPWKVDVAFYIAPLINAVIRSGTIEEKTQFFEGFINNGSEELIVSMSKGREREETLYQYLARSAYNLRNRQNTQKEKVMASLQKLIEKNKLHENKVIIITTDDVNVPMNITGLAAMEIVNMYNKPTLLLRPVKEDNHLFYRGSGRGIKVDKFYDFQHTLLESGLMDYCEGHDNAFGASIESTKIDQLQQWLNEKLSDVDFVSTTQVDCSMDNEVWQPLVLKEFGEMTNVYGSGIPQPKFHFLFTGRPGDVRIQGKNSDSLRISYKGVAFVAFQCKEWVEQFNRLAEQANSNGCKIEFEIIGAAEINEFNGFRNIQVMVKELEMRLSNAALSLF